MVLGVIRQWWWRRGYKRFYASPVVRENPYAMNAGTAERFEQLVNELQGMLEASEDVQVLDLGGGNGRLSARVFERRQRLVVMDFCRTAMEAAPSGESSQTNARRFVVGDMKQPPFRAGSFTVLFTYSTLPHLASERQIQRIFEVWDPLLAQGGILYIGDIPERKAVPSIVARALPRLASLSGLKYCVAILMNNYFSRRKLAGHLAGLGYEVRCLDQASGRRFHRERFDILARKRQS